MPLEETYEAIYPSIVALGSLRVEAGPDGELPNIPAIFGTGFVVDERGIILTAGHIARRLRDEPAHPVTGQRSALAIFVERPHDTGDHLVCKLHWVPLEAVALVEGFKNTAGDFFGEAIPDIGCVQVRAKELPRAVAFSENDWGIRIGRSIAFAGFPFGSDALTLSIGEGPIKVVQGTPLLRHGIVSGVHPFPCAQPHGFTIDAMSHGGASGSPVFSIDSPNVIGMLYAAMAGEYRYTYAISSSVLKSGVENLIAQTPFQFGGFPTLTELITQEAYSLNAPPLFLSGGL